LTGFPHKDFAFFAGGYDATYYFLDRVFAIDTDATLGNSTLVIVDKSPLLVARGDVSSVTNDDSTYAMVTGGFGPIDGFCAPERAVDIYDFQSDSWSAGTPVPIGRSDNALVELNALVFSVGGERQVDMICELDDASKPEPGEQTIPVEDVVVFDWGTRNWTLLPKLPDHLFRMSAAGVDEISTFFVFGGQTGYDSDCRCFRASSNITVFKVRTEDAMSPGGSGGSSAAVAAQSNHHSLWFVAQCMMLLLCLV
jgi:hypothetical protein